MQCPIVLGVEGEAKALLEAADAGIAMPPESAEALVAAVVRLADDPQLRARLGANGAAHVREHFDRSRLAARYLDVLSAVAAGGRPVAAVPAATTTAPRQVGP